MAIPLPAHCLWYRKRRTMANI
nr:unnamed protein product [Callosobruchus chinensis]